MSPFLARMETLPTPPFWSRRTDICSCKRSAKVSLMLDNPFLFPSLCKLNHVSVCFIQISTKPLATVYSLQVKQYFFEVIPGVWGCLLNFNITYRFLLRWPVFLDYPFLMTMMNLRIWGCEYARIPTSTQSTSA